MGIHRGEFEAADKWPEDFEHATWAQADTWRSERRVSWFRIWWLGLLADQPIILIVFAVPVVLGCIGAALIALGVAS